MVIEHRAFPLRPAPAASVPFTGTYREEGWRRCGAMAAADGIVFTPWPHGSLPRWSVPALATAKCVAKLGDQALTERVHLALYEALFTRSLDISDLDVLATVVGEQGGDAARVRADLEAGIGRDEVLADYEAAVGEHGVRAIPAVIVPATGSAIVGLAEAAVYRAAVEEAAG